MALGNPIGNFHAFPADDGSLIDPHKPPPEVQAIDKRETWLVDAIELLQTHLGRK